MRGLAYIEKLVKYSSCAYNMDGGPCASCGWQASSEAEDYMLVAGRTANLFRAGGQEGAGQPSPKKNYG